MSGSTILPTISWRTVYFILKFHLVIEFFPNTDIPKSNGFWYHTNLHALYYFFTHSRPILKSSVSISGRGLQSKAPSEEGNSWLNHNSPVNYRESGSPTRDVFMELTFWRQTSSILPYGDQKPDFRGILSKRSYIEPIHEMQGAVYTFLPNLDFLKIE